MKRNGRRLKISEKGKDTIHTNSLKDFYCELAIYNQIEELPKCQMVFKMAYIEGKKSNEFAGILNLPIIRTVEHQLYLGLKTICEKLERNK